MTSLSLTAALDRQWRSRIRSVTYLGGAVVPVLLISALLYQTAKATASPATVLFLAILSALWVGGSSNVREIVDERRLVQREPHLSLLAYGLAKVTFAIVLGTVQSVIIVAFLWSTDVVHLPFLNLWLILFLTTLSGALLAMVLSALCDEASTALAWFPLLLVPQVVFGGFLFPYGATRPFALDQANRTVTVMPEPLIRPKVTSPVLRFAGALCVSRWALEAYAAEVFEQDLNEPEKLQEAVQVAFFIPLSLTREPISNRLLDYLAQRDLSVSTPPTFDAATQKYRLLLAGFAIVQIVLLLVILPLRDPRRARG